MKLVVGQVFEQRINYVQESHSSYFQSPSYLLPKNLEKEKKETCFPSSPRATNNSAHWSGLELFYAFQIANAELFQVIFFGN